MKRINTIADFERHVFPEPMSGCWLWDGTLNEEGGYAMFSFRGETSGHRASWMIHHGPIPDGLFVLHKCDVRCCVNPDHLFLGTHSDNMRDCVRKGRFGRNQNLEIRYGEDHRSAKLTWNQVHEMRSMKGRRYTEISKIFNVTPENVSSIMRGLTWKVAR